MRGERQRSELRRVNIDVPRQSSACPASPDLSWLTVAVRLQRTDTSIQRKRIQPIAGRNQHMLTAIDQVGLRSVRHVADARVPQRACRSAASNATKFPDTSPREEQPAGRRQQTRDCRGPSVAARNLCCQTVLPVL